MYFRISVLVGSVRLAIFQRVSPSTTSTVTQVTGSMALPRFHNDVIIDMKSIMIMARKMENLLLDLILSLFFCCGYLIFILHHLRTYVLIFNHIIFEHTFFVKGICKNLRPNTRRAYLIYLKNIMEITLRKGLEPVNAAKDRPNQCLSAASFEKAP